MALFLSCSLLRSPFDCLVFDMCSVWIFGWHHWAAHCNHGADFDNFSCMSSCHAMVTLLCLSLFISSFCVIWIRSAVPAQCCCKKCFLFKDRDQCMSFLSSGCHNWRRAAVSCVPCAFLILFSELCVWFASTVFLHCFHKTYDSFSIHELHPRLSSLSQWIFLFLSDHSLVSKNDVQQPAIIVVNQKQRWTPWLTSEPISSPTLCHPKVCRTEQLPLNFACTGTQFRAWPILLHAEVMIKMW
mgnify:CR=1 FL=1